MKYLLLCFAFVGCTSTNPPAPGPTPVGSATPSPSIGCSLEQSLANAMASGVASALGCTGTAQIQADILTAAGKANLCASVEAAKKTITALKAEPKGVLGNVVCPMIVSQIGAVIASKIPSAWACTGSATVADAQAKLTTLCESNIGI